MIIGSSAAKLPLPFGSNNNCGDVAIANGDELVGVVVVAVDVIAGWELTAGTFGSLSTCALLISDAIVSIAITRVGRQNNHACLELEMQLVLWFPSMADVLRPVYYTTTATDTLTYTTYYV